MSTIGPTSPLQSAASGLYGAAQRFDAAASAVAADPTGDAAVQQVVNFVTSKENFIAELKVVQVAGNLQKRVLDIKV